MESVSGKYWEESKINQRIFEKIKSENNFPDIINKLILLRSFNKEEIFTINNKIKLINPFFRIKDFEVSFNTLKETIEKKGKILIIGDYDVDGIVSTALFIKFLKILNYPYDFYIPDRLKDGYGASLKLIKKLIKKKPNLVIMLDCGSNSNESVELLNMNSINSIIIDHHEIHKPYPKTKNLINPKKECDYENFNYLCSASITFFFIDYFLNKEKLKNDFNQNLIYVLLATVCDVMPLRYINRIIAKNIMQNFDFNKNYFFNKLFEISKINRPLNIEDLGFLIGPMINSSGRIGNPNKAVNLLIATENKLVDKLISELIELNKKRKNIEENIIKSLDFSKINNENTDVIILILNSVNEGLIGILASKIKEYFNKPSIIFTQSGNYLKGSGRSTENFNMGQLIKLGIDKDIIKHGGGHNLAVGLLIEKSKFNKFKDYMNLSYKKIIKDNNIKKYVSKITLSAVNQNFYNELSLMEPFGSNNQNPVFLIENVTIVKSAIIKNKFVSCILGSKINKSVNAISFNLINSEISKYLLNYKKEIKILAQIKQNTWNNKKSLQLNILDVVI
ncbi:MAG: DHH family phosphoesterase [Rhizobiales bacterium]|nr:DHH family phosphoesterase [Hyphomicrobiales bacterium]